MPLLIKHIWVLPLLILFIFRDSILGLGNDDSGNTGASSGRTDTPDEAEKDDNGATLSNTQSQQLANRLEKAMRMATYTDEDAIWEVFKDLKNQADLNKVYNHFGLRQYDVGIGVGGFPFSPEYDLWTWLEEELTMEEKHKLRSDFPHLNII